MKFAVITHPGGRSRFRAVAMLILACLLLASCGPLNDDDEPTATADSISQPTSEPDAATEVDDSVTEAAATPPLADDSTPATDQDVASTPIGPFTEGPSTPENGSTAIISTPEVPGITGEDGPSTPDAVAGTEGSAETPAPFTGSDGTSGATPISVDSGSRAGTPESDIPEATPDGTPGLAVLEETAAAPGIDLTTIEPVEVTSCEPENVPILIDGELEYLTTFDVNFRAGPGSDCDTIGDGPLGANIPVLVVSAPVVRQGEDDFLWVQVRVNDITGWVIVDAIEPAG